MAYLFVKETSCGVLQRCSVGVNVQAVEGRHMRAAFVKPPGLTSLKVAWFRVPLYRASHTHSVRKLNLRIVYTVGVR